MDDKICGFCQEVMQPPPYRITKAYWEKRQFCSPICRARGRKHAPRTGIRLPLEERFWSKVQVCEHGRMCRECCWPWIGAKNRDGYGIMYRTRKPKVTWYRAHCLSHELFIGPIPEGLHVLHDCPNGDLPACVNYNGHLWLGTQADNNADRDRKGRGGAKGGHLADQRGMKNGNARLPDEVIASIRMLYATGRWSQTALAKEFGCGQTHISRLVREEQRPKPREGS